MVSHADRQTDRVMMSKKDKAKKAADLERLRLQFPGTYSDFVAGRIASLRPALKIAGLRPERSQLQKMKNAWKKAQDNERQAFSDWLSTQQPAAFTPPAAPTTRPLIANGRYLLPKTIFDIETIMKARGMTPSDVMQEMGFGHNDRTLLKAMARKTSLRLKVIEALGQWIESHKDTVPKL